eukprot:820003_1
MPTKLKEREREDRFFRRQRQHTIHNRRHIIWRQCDKNQKRRSSQKIRSKERYAWREIDVRRDKKRAEVYARQQKITVEVANMKTVLRQKIHIKLQEASSSN